MQAFDQIKNECSYRWDQISEALPTNTLNEVLKSGIYSFAITTILTGNPITGTVAAAAAMTASAVHALLTPVFRNLASNNLNPNRLEWYQETARIIISLSFASATAALCGYRLDIITSCALSFCINLISPKRDLDASIPYIFI